MNSQGKEKRMAVHHFAMRKAKKMSKENGLPIK
jgi:hypothetical protein